MVELFMIGNIILGRNVGYRGDNSFSPRNMARAGRDFGFLDFFYRQLKEGNKEIITDVIRAVNYFDEIIICRNFNKPVPKFESGRKYSVNYSFVQDRLLNFVKEEFEGNTKRTSANEQKHHNICQNIARVLRYKKDELPLYLLPKKDRDLTTKFIESFSPLESPVLTCEN